MATHANKDVAVAAEEEQCKKLSVIRVQKVVVRRILKIIRHAQPSTVLIVPNVDTEAKRPVSQTQLCRSVTRTPEGKSDETVTQRA